ncbi:TPA: hypothetical protein VNH74_001029 [Streptococcus pyogenes]|nr:hypothetical protein [Streptococcus pyogenes]
MMTTFEKIIKKINRIEGGVVKPEAERRDRNTVFLLCPSIDDDKSYGINNRGRFKT